MTNSRSRSPPCEGVAFFPATRTGDTLWTNAPGQQGKRRRRSAPSRTVNCGSSSSSRLISLSALIICLPFLCERVAAFPNEALGWGQLSRLAPYRTRQQLQQPACLLRLETLHQSLQSSLTFLEMARNDAVNYNPDSDDHDSSENGKRRFGKKDGRKQRLDPGRGFGRRPRGGDNATTTVMHVVRNKEASATTSDREKELMTRMTQLEHLVAKQTVEIRRLQDECRDLKEDSSAFARVLEMLRASGLDTDDWPDDDDDVSLAAQAEEQSKEILDNAMMDIASTGEEEDVDVDGEEPQGFYEYFDDSEIFGEAPASVTEAADSAGAAILAGLLGGKQRMLVDVRDSELSRDPETLVQFIELAILPVAAGLEGLQSKKNRVKIVFPTVSQLLEYRRTMALAAPEVVALSTLGFDPVEEHDNIVVIIAPAPDNHEGIQIMNDLLEPPAGSANSNIRQPVVVLNHHMLPVSGPAAKYDVMYHLRLLSVQYMSGDRADDIFSQFDSPPPLEEIFDDTKTANMTVDAAEDLLEAAMKHAQEVGVNRGLTRAMVIRSYPKPWHVFVDISPATDADFVVAATFDNEPGMEDVNSAIVECLEGSEREDEIVAQQMQEALDMDTKQLGPILNQNSIAENIIEGTEEDEDEDDDDDDEYDDFYDLWNEDSV